MPGLSYSINLNLADVFQKSLQIQEGIRQSVQSVLGNGAQSYGRVSNTYTGNMNLTPQAFSPPSQMQGMFPPVTYNPPAWLYQPWGLEGQLSQQGYYGAPSVAAQLARGYNALPGWLGAVPQSVIGTLGWGAASFVASKLLSKPIFGKGFLTSVAEKGLFKAVQEAPMMGLGGIVKSGGAIGRMIGEAAGGGLLGDIAEGAGTLAGIGGVLEFGNAAMYPFTKAADYAIKGISTSVHMYNQAAKIGQTFIRPGMFGGRGLTVSETDKLGQELAKQRFGLEESYSWVKGGDIAAIHESAIGIAMANPMAPFWSSQHGGNVTDSFAKAVDAVTKKLIDLGQTTLATTKQLASGMAGLQQIGVTGGNTSLLRNADTLGTITGQGFDSIMQQTVAAGNRFLGTGIKAQLGTSIAQTSIAGTYGAIFNGDIGAQSLAQLGGAQNAAQAVTIGTQGFVQSQMGSILLSGMFGTSGKFNQNMAGANPMALASATAGSFGGSPAAYLAWLNQRGNMIGDLKGSDVSATYISLAAKMAGSNNPAAMAGALQTLMPNLSAPQAYAMVATAQNQMQSETYNYNNNLSRMAVAQKYAIRSQFKIGSVVGALLGNTDAGAAVEATLYGGAAIMGGTLERAGSAVFSPIIEGYNSIRESYRRATGSPGALERLPSPTQSDFRISGLTHMETINGQRIEVSSRADAEYTRKHHQTQSAHILQEIDDATSAGKWRRSLGFRTYGDVSGLDIGSNTTGIDQFKNLWKMTGSVFLRNESSKEVIDAAEKKVADILKSRGKTVPTSVEDTEAIIKGGGAAALGVLKTNGMMIVPTRAYNAKDQKVLDKQIQNADYNLHKLGSDEYRKSMTDEFTKEEADKYNKDTKGKSSFAAALIGNTYDPRLATAEFTTGVKILQKGEGLAQADMDSLEFITSSARQRFVKYIGGLSRDKQIALMKEKLRTSEKYSIQQYEKQGLTETEAKEKVQFNLHHVGEIVNEMETGVLTDSININKPGSTEKAAKPVVTDAYSDAAKKARAFATSLDGLAKMAKQ